MPRFGIQLEPMWGFDYQDYLRIAGTAERAGFDSLWVSDHLFLDEHATHRSCFEAWTILTALAPATERLRLGTLVTCNGYRLPSILAKMAACLDQVSGGRLEFGIGAGWKKVEYLAYGMPFPPLATRVKQLEEAIRLIRLLWTEERVSFQGEHYRLEDAICAPKPLQKPLAVWVGGAEESLLLPLVAELADGWNMLPGVGLSQVEGKLEVLQWLCEERGRDFGAMRKSLFAEVILVEDARELDHRSVELAETLGAKGEEVVERAKRVGTAGTSGEVAETLRRFQTLGFHDFIIMFPYRHDEEMLLRFAETVAPSLE